jgi:hypothetical protein
MNKLVLASPLAIVLALSIITVPALASGGLTENNPDFHIVDVDKFSMEVAGEAGSTVPTDQRHVFAYVFLIEGCGTDLCGYAVTSHFPEDSTEVGSDIEWHAHYVEVTAGCVSLLTEDGDAELSGSEVSVNGAKGKVFAGASVVLQIDLETGVCIQNIIDIQGV